MSKWVCPSIRRSTYLSWITLLLMTFLAKLFKQTEAEDSVIFHPGQQLAKRKGVGTTGDVRDLNAVTIQIAGT